MTWHDYLDLAQKYADKVSGCTKVAVGSVLLAFKTDHIVSFGANQAMPDLCKTRGCLRKELYGDDSKIHRNPADCRAIHSEIDAICSAAFLGTSITRGTIVVTRYPCENCAKAIISAGIQQVVYGGTAKISEQTAALFEECGVNYIHIEDWKEDLTDR